MCWYKIMHQNKRVVRDFFKPSRHLLLSWIDKVMANGLSLPSFPKFCLTQSNDHGIHHCTVHYYKVLILITLYFSIFDANSTIYYHQLLLTVSTQWEIISWNSAHWCLSSLLELLQVMSFFQRIQNEIKMSFFSICTVCLTDGIHWHMTSWSCMI